MKKIALILGLLVSFQSNASDLRELCDYVEGSIIISSDSEKKYLGKIASSYDSDSIFNEYGKYGGEYSSNSIWNSYSKYGNEYNSYSPFNEYSLNPPIVIKNNRVIAKLTVNDSISNALNPYVLKACKF
ncbi:hypothetical protein ACT4WO_20270 (plasmid) [Acinetobacter baumannii]|uniref:hypothetical protein n=1 Tax=Acinetobacter baumannii TaxID=470 RepID=UPI0037BF75F1